MIVGQREFTVVKGSVRADIVENLLGFRHRIVVICVYIDGFYLRVLVARYLTVRRLRHIDRRALEGRHSVDHRADPQLYIIHFVVLELLPESVLALELVVDRALLTRERADFDRVSDLKIADFLISYVICDYNCALIREHFVRIADYLVIPQITRQSVDK